MTDPLRIGIIGAGMVSAHHLAAWADIAGTEVVAIADPDIARARARADEHGIASAHASAAAMLDAEPLDAVDILTPVDTHAVLCRLAAAQGLAIMCQKPLCTTHEDARHLAAELSGVRIKVHENWRFRPEYRAVQTLLAQGMLGRVRRVAFSCRSSGLIAQADGVRPALARQPFLATLPRLLVFELLVHHLDVLTWLLGPLSVASAQLRQVSGATVGEDEAQIGLTAQSGAEVTLSGSFADPDAPAAPVDTLVIEGEAGRLAFSAGTLTVEGAHSSSESFPFDRSYPASYRNTIADFVAGLRSGRPFETEPAEHVATLALVETVYALSASSTLDGSSDSTSQPLIAR